MSSGKKQRAKKGVQAASAAGAAALLGSAGGGGFIGFSAFAAPTSPTEPKPSASYDKKASESLVPYYEGEDSDLQIALKKVSKKDVTTKMKALQEFRALIASREPKILRGTLPHWTYLYNQLTMNNDRRVRELGNTVQLELSQKITKAMRNQLKKLFGAWWVAISDPYKPAANKAQEAYNTAFPPEKRREVVLFCKQELFAHFGHNLRSTPQSLVAILSVKMEKLEAAEMHERVLAMTLAAVARVFTFLSAAGDDGSQSPLHQLEGECSELMKGQFWRVLASKHAPIRRAAYTVVSEVIRHFPALMEQQLPSATSPILGILGEKDVGSFAPMWQALCLFVRAFPQAWQLVKNPGQQVFSRLWALLRHGCRGAASVSYPCLLPFVAALPALVRRGGGG